MSSYKNLLPIEQGLKGYLNFDISNIEKEFIDRPPEYFQDQGKEMTLDLFKQMSQRVPAYQDFLKKKSIDADKITTFDDLSYVPWIDKNNYLKEYPLDAVSWDGQVSGPIISSSSGSSGKPTFWPRSNDIEMETSYIFELFLKNFYEIDKHRTLLISGLAMGIYVGGSFTLNCCMRASQKGYPLTIITPGVNKKEFIESIEQAAPFFDQIILAGYPPLIKDIIDECEYHNIRLDNKKIKIHFAAESITESFRQYIYNKCHIDDKDYLYSSLNLYGTADAGVAGHETPLSILIRKKFSETPDRTKKYFNTTNVPSLNLYYPFLKYFQTIDDELIFSTRNNAIPLCKYNIHDHGKTIEFNEMINLAESFGYNKESLEKEIKSKHLWHLPYVYLHGKSDNSVKLCGALIYIDPIRKVLESQNTNNKHTGKIALEIIFDSDHNQQLLIHVEQKKGIEANLTDKKSLLIEITKQLLKDNAEFKVIYTGNPNRQILDLMLHQYESPKYFSSRIKQKWVIK